MKEFIIHLLGFLLVLVSVLSLAVAGDYFWVGNQYEQNYQASLLDKVERLKAINEPKIILVGNSNVAFGIRSQMLEDYFKMPVVNLGLHGSLGNRFHEDIAKLNINEGDIVIICHSDYDDDGSVSDYGLELLTLEWHKELWAIVSRKDYFGLIRSAPAYFIEAYKLKINNMGNQPGNDCYSRTAFNEYGDNIFAQKDEGRTFDFTEGVMDEFIPTVSDICVDRINKLNDYVTDRDATLLIAGFPIADGEYTADHSVYYEFERELQENIDCLVISSVDDYFMDYSFFYNSTLHLTEEGAVLRTRQLITDLNNYIKETS